MGTGHTGNHQPERRNAGAGGASAGGNGPITGLSHVYGPNGVELRNDANATFLVLTSEGSMAEVLPGDALRMPAETRWYVLKVEAAATNDPGKRVLAPCVQGDNCWIPLATQPSVRVAGVLPTRAAPAPTTAAPAREPTKV